VSIVVEMYITTPTWLTDGYSLVSMPLLFCPTFEKPMSTTASKSANIPIDINFTTTL